MKEPKLIDDKIKRHKPWYYHKVFLGALFLLVVGIPTAAWVKYKPEELKIEEPKIEEPKIVVLIGAIGSGKSTLANWLLGADACLNEAE